MIEPLLTSCFGSPFIETVSSCQLSCSDGCTSNGQIHTETRGIIRVQMPVKGVKSFNLTKAITSSINDYNVAHALSCALCGAQIVKNNASLLMLSKKNM